VFERFTESARAVVVLAQEEARRLDHESIGTEHVLLALLHDAESIAGEVLTGFGLGLAALREDVEAAVGRGAGTGGSQIPFAPQSKKLLELGLREALQLGHAYIGTEHLLLALVRDETTLGAQLLLRRGIDAGAVRIAVAEALGARGEDDEPTGPGPQLPA